MDGIAPVGCSPTAPQAPAAPGVAAPAGPAGPAAASAASASSAASMSATSSVSTVYSSVNMMLGSIDSGLAGNDMLKMAIALLILQTMMGKKEEGDAGGMDLLGALAAGIMAQGGAGSGIMMMESSSSSVSMEQSVSMSHVQETYAGGNPHGGNINATA